MSSVWEPVPPVGPAGITPSYGSTAQRPTLVPYLYFEYFDTTLNQPVFATTLQPVSPAVVIVWVNSAGVAV